MKEEIAGFEQQKTCFLCSYPPRECGIATFTRDLTNAMDRRFNPRLKSEVIAINKDQDIYNYSKKVVLELNEGDIEDYINVAKQINSREDIKIVCIQHEFGLFGGEYGSYIVPFLETLKKPVVVTFHSVLPKPDELRKKVVSAIALRSAAIIVMAKTAVDILEKDYGINKDKIFVVHHGIPNVKLKDSEEIKKELRLDGKLVLSTFGLLSRGKGIEYVIKSLPPLVKKYPNLLYLIIGETHPVVRKKEGEKYREELEELIIKLEIRKNVKFYNKYLSLKEIINYLQATDVYIFTNLEQNQITSGTLAYAMGCGKAIVSTPTLYSKELLQDKRGIIVRLMDPDSYTEAIDKLLSDSSLRREMEKNAYTFSRQMIWSNVALNYLKIFNQVITLRKEITEKFPPIKLDHLENMTDEIGIIQFANHTEPDKNSGYTLDDNSRALIVAVSHNSLFKSKRSLRLMNTYLNFIERAQDSLGNFKNHHNNVEESLNPKSEDSIGRAIWALGFSIYKLKNRDLINKSESILNNSIGVIKNLNSPRAKAFSIIGLYYYYKKKRSNEILELITTLVRDLVSLYNSNSTEDWKWFESYLTYDNSKLSEALFLAFDLTKNEQYLKIAEESLNFLIDLTIIDGKLYPIGENGWYIRNNQRAFFDQQPIDASSMAQTLLVANKVTGKKDYYEKAVIAFNWFLGHNHLNQMIYDEATGGCFDGLGKRSLNFNQGAESTISYLMARLHFEEHNLLLKREIESNFNFSSNNLIRNNE
ncbi:MAG: glycosyltransferase [Candidatus Pacearchaeota archaeon]